jgi:hypothetical protein
MTNLAGPIERYATVVRSLIWRNRWMSKIKNITGGEGYEDEEFVMGCIKRFRFCNEGIKLGWIYIAHWNCFNYLR